MQRMPARFDQLPNRRAIVDRRRLADVLAVLPDDPATLRREATVRLKQAVDRSRGFVYAVSTMGITGARTDVDTAARGLVAGGGYNAGSATLDGTGKATITISTPSVGAFGYSAQYYGDLTYQASNSTTVRVDVAPDALTPVVILPMRIILKIICCGPTLRVRAGFVTSPSH